MKSKTILLTYTALFILRSKNCQPIPPGNMKVFYPDHQFYHWCSLSIWLDLLEKIEIHFWPNATTVWASRIIIFLCTEFVLISHCYDSVYSSSWLSICYLHSSVLSNSLSARRRSQWWKSGQKLINQFNYFSQKVN